jgi:DNA-binding NarL/FixJ family response regulator
MARIAEAGPVPMPEKQIRVLCVDDHRLMREGIAAVIGRQSDMQVVAAAMNGVQAVEMYKQHRPDVTLMDLQLPIMGGLEAISAIRRFDATARVIVLTMYQGDEDIHLALHAGAATYLLKDAIVDDLPRVVREVHAGGRPIPSDVAQILARRAELPPLTCREKEVLELIAQGCRNKEIAAALNISKETAKVHVKNILTKLNVSDRSAAITAAVRRGILHVS